MHTRSRWGGVVAAASAAVLAVPLSAIGPAHAVVDRADVSISKTVVRAVDGTTVDESQFIAPGQAGTALGHGYQFVAGGLQLQVTGPADQVAQYFPRVGALPTSVSMEYTPSTGVAPGYQILFDTDADTSNGFWNVLVSEDGSNWWTSPATGADAKAHAPHSDGPGNRTYYGTLAEWIASLAVDRPNARMLAGGFSLGSGAQASTGVLKSLTFGTDRYAFGTFAGNAQSAPGETVEYKLAVTNTGTLPATGVMITDTLPADLTYVPGSLIDNGNGCSFTGQTLTCNAGTFPNNGTTAIIKYKATLSRQSGVHVPATAGHAITTQTKEATLGIAADADASQTATCDPGFIATDGGFYVDPIAGGFYSDLVTTASGPTADNSGWTVSATNYGDVAAGGKVYVNCINELLGSSSGHTHAVQVTDLADVDPGTWAAAGTRTINLTCPAGTRPIAPGFSTEGGVGVVRESYPHTSQVWRFIVDNDEDTTMHFGARCLASETTTANGHTATMAFSDGISTSSVPAETRVEGSVACPAGRQALVGGYSGYDANVLSLGKKPNGSGYQFRFYNEDWETAYSADMLATCVATSTSTEPGAISNTATVTTTELEQNTSNNSSTATVKVVGDPAALVFLGNTAVRHVVSGKVRGIDIQVKCLVACTFGAKVYKSGTVVAKATKSLRRDDSFRTVRIKTTDAGKNVTAGTIRITLVTSEGTLTANPATLS